MGAHHVHPVEERADIVLDDAPEENEVVALFISLVRKGNHALQDARHLHDGEIRVDPFSLEMDDNVQALVEKLGEGM